MSQTSDGQEIDIEQFFNNKSSLLETMEESQNKIQRTQEVRGRKGKGMDMCQYAKWELVL